jgi:hypothetical protein
MNDSTSLPQIIRSQLRTFLFVSLGTLLVLSIVVFFIAKDFAVKSSIEIGSALVNDRLEPLEPPELVARQISLIYLPAALLALAQKGVSVSELDAIQNLKAEPVGRSVILYNIGEASLEELSKGLQQIIIDRVIKDRTAFVSAVRTGLDIKIDSARRTSADLLDQSKALVAEIEEAGLRAEAIRKQLDTNRTELSAKFQRAAPIKSTDERVTIEAEIRELRDQISTEESLGKDVATERSRAIRDLAEIRRYAEDQAKIIASAERDKAVLNETRTTLPPSLIPLPLGPRRIFVLLAALAVSILLAFGTAAMSARFGGRKLDV